LRGAMTASGGIGYGSTATGGTGGGGAGSFYGDGVTTSDTGRLSIN